MLILLLFGQLIAPRFQIVSSHPPLSAEAAIAVLRSSHSPIDHTDLPPPELFNDGPRVYIMGGSPGDGPFGAFPSYPLPIERFTPYYTSGYNPYRPYSFNYRAYDSTDYARVNRIYSSPYVRPYTYPSVPSSSVRPTHTKRP